MCSLVSEPRIVKARLLGLRQIAVLLLHDLVTPDVVELSQHKKSNVGSAQRSKALVRGVVYEGQSKVW